MPCSRSRPHDQHLAQFVVADDDRIDGRYLEVHQGVLSLLALQAPVAGDLRVVAAVLYVINNIERVGDQCVNIAKLIPLAGQVPEPPNALLDRILRMGALARDELGQARRAFAERDVALALLARRAGPGDPALQPRGLPPRRAARARTRPCASGR